MSDSQVEQQSPSWLWIVVDWVMTCLAVWFLLAVLGVVDMGPVEGWLRG